MIRRFAPLIIFAVLVAAFGYGLTRDDPRILDSAMIDKPMPEFSLPSLYEPELMLSDSMFKGQVSLVNVFGSWCVACVQEHQTLMDIKQSGAVPIIGVDWRDTREAGQRWLARYGDPYDSVIFDEDSLLAIDLGITGAPESFIIGKDGRIRYKHVGIITREIWSKEIKALVQALQNEVPS